MPALLLAQVILQIIYEPRHKHDQSLLKFAKMLRNVGCKVELIPVLPWMECALHSQLQVISLLQRDHSLQFSDG